MSKTPEMFGKGAPQGVCAGEAADNGSIGGAMIPLLTMGIPGSATAAVLLGALMNDQPLESAAQIALDMTHAAIVETVRSGEPLRYGMQFEKTLPLFWQRISR